MPDEAPTLAVGSQHRQCHGHLTAKVPWYAFDMKRRERIGEASFPLIKLADRLV
jgi:hypothetical protein